LLSEADGTRNINVNNVVHRSHVHQDEDSHAGDDTCQEHRSASASGCICHTYHHCEGVVGVVSERDGKVVLAFIVIDGVPVVVDLDVDLVTFVQWVVSDWPAEVLGHAVVGVLWVDCRFDPCQVHVP
jgi:hypothetical protein